MDDLTRARIERMHALDAEGRFEELLAYLEALYAETEAAPAPSGPDYFMTMFQWNLLIEKYPPAARALGLARDEQVRRLLKGEPYTGTAAWLEDPREMFERVERISLITKMNETLGDARATYVLFQQLEAQQPALARRYGWRVLPAVVEVGDFAMADRLRGEPLSLLRSVNCAAATMPLFPPGREAPRLAADLSSLCKDVRIATAVLRGLGREPEAQALRCALLEGLATEELRGIAERELEVPGTIFRMHGERQAELDGLNG